MFEAYTANSWYYFDTIKKVLGVIYKIQIQKRKNYLNISDTSVVSIIIENITSQDLL